MAVVPTRVSTTTTATLLASNTAKSDSEGDFRTKRCLLKNVTASAPVFLGGSDVATGTGFQWDPTDGALAVELEAGESLYGIVTTVNQAVHVLTSGR